MYPETNTLPKQHTSPFRARYVDKTDMSLFEKNYHNDAKGAAAYPPALLLKAILFCYSRGIITSRKIERAC
jgi:transposase